MRYGEAALRVKILSFLSALILLFCLIPGVAGAGSPFPEDSLSGVKEGWAWPVVVVPPPEGWDSPSGRSIKAAMRSAEREISLRRDAIRGHEVTFMFSSISRPSGLNERMAAWRSMGAGVIVSFGGGEMDEALMRLCTSNGPPVDFAGGEDLAIIDSAAGVVNPYLFALDLPYFARANALAEVAAAEEPQKKVAVMTDMMSEKLAKGAELNTKFLAARGIGAVDMSVSAYRQDQFNSQVRNAEAGGFEVFTCWLDAMAALSIWRTIHVKSSGSVVYYAGNQHRILLDAEGLILVDKDVLLIRNDVGRRNIAIKVRDMLNVDPEDTVAAAKAFALAKWVIAAHMETASNRIQPLASALAATSGIPLMDEDISINPATHRPVSRSFGVLRIEKRGFKSFGRVEVFSSEASE
ncbi:MAG: hypothetical protein LBO21_06200 [Synergistaceae bacterium]|nr:hypothetical protein [Synergistaceae bacterium]